MGVPYAELIGDPVAHSKSPLIHKFWLEKLDLDGDYRTVRLASGELPAYLERRRTDPGWRGCSVAMPHKRAVLPLLDRAMPEAQGAGAANTIVPLQGALLGYNSDVLALKSEILALADAAQLFATPVILIGAGGAARAVLQVLRDVPDAEVAIVNRSVAKAEALLAEFRIAGRAFEPGSPLPATTLVVNASSLGMSGFPELPVDSIVATGGDVVELVYSPVETSLLAAARARGRCTVDGLSILIAQARFAFELFFGRPAPGGHEDELRELLAR